MRGGKGWPGFLVALLFLVSLAAPRAWAADLGEIAPNFKAYEEVSEEDVEFYGYVGDHVAMLWIWDWSTACPV